MTKPFSVRLAGPGEIEAVLPLFDAQLREHEIFTPVEAIAGVLRQVIADARHGFVLIAVDGERQPIGVAYTAAHLSVEHGGVIGWLEELYVLPQWRGEGIGSRLLAEVIARAGELGWKGVQLEVLAGHERAIPFYLRHGFELLPRTLFRAILAP